MWYELLSLGDWIGLITIIGFCVSFLYATTTFIKSITKNQEAIISMGKENKKNSDEQATQIIVMIKEYQDHSNDCASKLDKLGIQYQNSLLKVIRQNSKDMRGLIASYNKKKV